MEQEQPARRRRGRPKGIPGIVTRTIRYVCGTCHQEKPKEKLLAKRAVWQTLGSRPTTIRTRTVAWVCTDCISKDPDFMRDPYSESPGFADIYGEGGTRAAAEEGPVAATPQP